MLPPASMRTWTALLAAVLVAGGCTSVHVRPVDPTANLKHVCIQENPKVIVPNFLPIVREGFDRHGISTEVYPGDVPASCEYVLTYTALRSWDVAPYLSHAELHLASGGQEVASAEYHLVGKGGYSLMKWQAVKTKMDPVIDELLASYHQP
jgi:hypothetical protein